MTDHYLAYLQSEVRDLRQQIGHLQGRLDSAHADRDSAREEADTLTLILTAILADHRDCDASWCGVMKSIAQVAP